MYILPFSFFTDVSKMDLKSAFQVYLLPLFIFISNILEGNIVVGFEYDFVTCGSSVKLLNTRNNVRLHSHDVKYGSGSGQQSVTAVSSTDDNNSYWQVRGKSTTECLRGEPVKCSQTITLMHLNTGLNLHSHHFQSPLSHNLEVSAFEGTDSGDNWVVVCSDKYWRRDSKVRLKHAVTDHYLHVTGDSYGRPIHGQKEVSGYPSPSDLNYWKVMEGIYITPTDFDQITHYSHDEL